MYYFSGIILVVYVLMEFIINFFKLRIYNLIFYFLSLIDYFWKLSFKLMKLVLYKIVVENRVKVSSKEEGIKNLNLSREFLKVEVCNNRYVLILFFFDSFFNLLF